MTGDLLSPSAQTAAWAACILSTFACLVLLAATRTSVAPGSLVEMASVVVFLAALHLVYTWLRPDPFIGPITGGLAALSWAGFAAGTAALGALRTGAPLIDDLLGQADAILGVDTHALIGWLARHPGIGLLEAAYASTVPLVFVAVVVLGWTRREIMMWELCFAFAGASMTSTLLSAFVPAVGTFAHHVMAPDVLSLLPAGAGRYYLPIFYAYRSGALNTVDIHHFDGVVTFPSFHAAMALMTAYAFRDVRWLFGPICIWSGLTLLATMPIGGHYAVDVVAGAGVWSIFALLHRVTRNGIHLCLHSAYAQRKLRPILQDYLGISMS